MIFLFNELSDFNWKKERKKETKKKEIWLLTISLETACKDEISSDG